jgi:hypothetical protein
MLELAQLDLQQQLPFGQSRALYAKSAQLGLLVGLHPVSLRGCCIPGNGTPNFSGK